MSCACYLDGTALLRLRDEPAAVSALVAAASDGLVHVVTSHEALWEAADLHFVAPGWCIRILHALSAELLPPSHSIPVLARELDHESPRIEDERTAVAMEPLATTASLRNGIPLPRDVEDTVSHLGSPLRVFSRELGRRLAQVSQVTAQAAREADPQATLWRALFDASRTDALRAPTVLLVLNGLEHEATPRVVERASHSPLVMAYLGVLMDLLAERILRGNRAAAGDRRRMALRQHHVIVGGALGCLVSPDPVLERVCAAAWNDAPRFVRWNDLEDALPRLRHTAGTEPEAERGA